MNLDGPYLSVVVTARNDDHGGDLLKRMQAFTDGWIEQCNRFELDAELVVVEWNPVEGRVPLAEALRWPQENRHCQVRVITVPASVHQRYRHADSMGLYQMIAKNVGIRRARGRFILATNIDILFSNELMERLVRRDLCPGKMYRMDRHDAGAEIPEEGGIEERLRWCSSHLLRVNARGGTFPLSPDGKPISGKRDVTNNGSGIYLSDDWYAPEENAGRGYRWMGKRATILLRAENGTRREKLMLDLEPGTSTGFGPFVMVVFGERGEKLCEHRVTKRQVVRIPVELEPGEEKELTLQAVGGNLRVDRDPRVMNLRLMRAGWSADFGAMDRLQLRGFKWKVATAYRRWRGFEIPPKPAQQYQREAEVAGIRFGEGWSDWENLGAGFVRMVRGEGVLELLSNGGWGELELDVEVGPDAAGQTVRMTLLDGDGRELAAADVEGRRSYRWTATHWPEQMRRMRVRAGQEGADANARLLIVHTFLWRETEPAGRMAGTLAETEDKRSPVLLHTNGCGDFTMLSREAWFQMRGYPEFDAFSMNIDSVLCWAAHHAGYREEMLAEPARIYHIEHGIGSGWTPEGQAALHHRVSQKRIQWLEYGDVISWARDMNRYGRPFLFNLDDWGLAGDEFAEWRTP